MATSTPSDMTTLIYVCDCHELDIDYNHTVDFDNKANQLNYFTNRQVRLLTNQSYHRKSDNVIRVDMSLSELKYANYLFIQNTYSGMGDYSQYFYFIVDKVYVNDYTTTLILQLDVIQTYLFDIQFKECFIERQHIPRWTYYNDGHKEPNTYYEQEDEGIDTGEYVIKSKTTLYDYSDKGAYIITSSEPLGITTSSASGGTSGGNTSSGNNYLNGYMDANGLRMIKSMEGFASIPYNIGDGTYTTGYGVTSKNHPDVYNSLLPTCTEQQASEALGELGFSTFSLRIKEQLDECNYNWDYMTQDLFNAMVSFAWNSGAYAMQYDWSDLWNLILTGENKNNPQNLLSVWSVTNIMIGSQFEQGLRNRRQREGLIAIGEYDYSNFIISNVSEGGTITSNNGYGYIPPGYDSVTPAYEGVMY